MLDILQTILYWSLPRVCLLCDLESEQPHLSLCKYCMQHLPWFGDGCRRCGVNLNCNAGELICDACKNNGTVYDQLYALFRYTAPLTVLINKLKFSGQIYCAELFAQLLCKQIQYKWYHKKELPEVIIPVPLHLHRYQQRGYNQVLEICLPLGRMLKIPVETKLVYRNIHTLAQSKLKLAQRLTNVQGAFAANYLPYKHIAIVDDVVTTGSTVRSLSLALLQAGVQQIDIWCVCRG